MTVTEAMIASETAPPRLPGRRNSRVLVAAGVVLAGGLAAGVVAVSVSKAPSKPGVSLSLSDSALSNPVREAAPSLGTALTSCTASAHGSDAVKGVLEIPELGVTAPVEQGTGNQLEAAVGHDLASVWPGATGNAVLAAHDAGYFTKLPALSAGDTILYVAPCTTYAFSVSSQSIVNPGSPVSNTREPGLTLVTGWPTDALGPPAKRYVVTAHEVSQSFTMGSEPYLAVSPPPRVPIPSALAGQEQDLATDSPPMGRLQLTASPDETWSQTVNPLTAEASAVEAYVAGVRSLTQRRLGWWKMVAPGVAAPAALVGAANPEYPRPLEVTELVTGTRVDSVTLTDEVALSGGRAPGRYAVSVGETIDDGTLVITRWSMQRI